MTTFDIIQNVRVGYMKIFERVLVDAFLMVLCTFRMGHFHFVVKGKVVNKQKKLG